MERWTKRFAPVGPAGLLGAARVGRGDGARRGLNPDALPVAGGVPAAGRGRASADLAASALDAEAGVAEGGEDEIRRPRTEHPNPGKRKIHPLLLRFSERRALRCPAVITIGRLIADAGGLRPAPPRLDTGAGPRRP